MKNILMIITTLVATTAFSQEKKCDREAEAAVKAVYAITDKSQGETSVRYIRTLENDSLGYEVKEYNVVLDVNGGSGVWVVQAIPSLGCMISKVELGSVD